MSLPSLRHRSLIAPACFTNLAHLRAASFSCMSSALSHQSPSDDDLHILSSAYGNVTSDAFLPSQSLDTSERVIMLVLKLDFLFLVVFGGNVSRLL